MFSNSVEMNILDNTSSGILVIDANYEIVFWNKTLELWSGLSKEEVKSKSLFDLTYDKKTNYYKKRLRSVFEIGSPAIFSSQFRPYFLNLKSTNGQLMIQQTYVSLTKLPECNQNLLSITITDMTQPIEQMKTITELRKKANEEIKKRELLTENLKASEFRLKQFFKSIPVPTYIWQEMDGQYYLNDFNDSALSIKVDIAKKVNRSVTKIFPMFEDISDLFDKCFLSKENVIAKFIVNDNDKRKFYNVKCAYVEPDYVLSHIEDITHVEEYEKEKAENARKSIALALGVTASHEINQPLMILKGNLELFEMTIGNETLTETQQKYLQRIEDSYNRINKILKKFHSAESVKIEEYSDRVNMLVYENQNNK